MADLTNKTREKTMTTSKKEVFLEDILDRILSNSSNITQDIQKLRNLIQYQRSFDNDKLESILASFGQGTKNVQTITNSHLPYPVAHLIKGVNAQHNELVKVLFLCDAVECFVRWRFSEMITVLHNTKGNIPDGSLGYIPNMIDRPSMGSWIAGFEHLAKQLDQTTRKVWGVDQNTLKKDLAILRDITQLRNKLAHGDISGGNNTIKYWTPISQGAKDIFKRYAKLKIVHFIVHNSKQYDATGQGIISRQSNLPHWQHQINNDPNHYGVFHATTSFQIPLTFKIDDSNTNDSVPFNTLSYISTQGKINTPTSGGSLEYTSIDGEGIKHIKELHEFITLFKLDKDPSSQEPWKGLLKEINNAVAWDVDQSLLKYRWDSASILSTTAPVEPESNSKEDIDACKEQVKDQIPTVSKPSKLWFFAGQSRSSKSTVLFSWAKKFQVRSNRAQVFVFSHRFSNGTPQDELDKFYRTLQDALTLWVREQKTLPDPDTSLTGVELRENVASLMQQFMELKFTSNRIQPSLIIALDDLQSLCNPNDNKQSILDTLLSEIGSWSKFTKKEVFQSGYNRERKVGTYQGKLSKQVFCIATSLDIPMGNTPTQGLDEYMVGRTNFVYDITTIPSVSSSKDTSDNSPTEFSIELAPAQIARWNEIVDAYQHPLHNNPPGAHLPLINQYGAKRLLLDDNINPQLVQILQIQRGTTYIQTLLNEAKGDASIIDAVGENLKSGHITIDDPITSASYDTIVPSIQNPFLQDISRLIPILVVFLEHPAFQTKASNTSGNEATQSDNTRIPLTVTSLELLCGRGYESTSQHEPYILEALYSIPRLVKRVALSESEANGDLAFGWILRAGADLKSIFQSDVLKLTQDLADRRINDLKAKLHLLSDSLQLKSLLLKDTVSLKGQALNPVQDIFRALRGQLSGGIRTVLQQNHRNHVLQNSASMLYQTNPIASPQITWLQKADESQRHQQDANGFINKPAFDDFWLRHVNAEHFPVFNHQVSAVGYDEGVERIIFINASFYLVIGGAKGVFNSISIYNVDRSIPDLELVGLSEPGTIADCIVQHIDAETIAVVYNIDQIVHVRILKLEFQAKDTGTHTTHNYQGQVVQIHSISATQVGIFGKRVTEKVYEIDVLSNLDQQSLHCQTVSSGVSKEFNLAVSHLGAIFALYKEQLIKVYLDQKNTVQVSSACKLAAAPKQDPIKINDGIVSGGGTTKAKRNATWYSASRHQAVTLKNRKGDKTFNLIIFAHELPNNRLLTVGYKGMLRVHEWIEPKKKTGKPDAAILLEHQLQLDQEVLDAKNHGLIGGLLEGSRLLLYGVKSFMAFFDITSFINDDDLTTPYPPSHRLSLHYGTIKDAIRISGVFFEHKDLFLTISEDNDARLWSFSSGDNTDNNDAYCVGLFRGHNGKMKIVEQCDDLLVTADVDKNIRSWKINDGCQNQLQALPQRSPSFIHSAFWYQSQVWVVATEGRGVYIQAYSNDGTTWSYKQALQRNSMPTCKKEYGDLRVIHLDKYLVLLVNGRLQSFDLTTQTVAPINSDGSEKGLKVSEIRYFDDGIITYDDTNIYTIIVKNKNLKLNTVHTIEEDRFITAIHCTPQGNQPHQIHFATTIGSLKDKGSLPREIWEITLSNETVTNQTLLDTISETTRVSGVWHDDGDILYWFDRSDTKVQLKYYLYRKSLGKRLDGPEKQLLLKGPTGIYRLPATQGDGFAFLSGDNDRRWTLLYNYEYGDDGVSSTKSLQTTVHTSWAYASTHFDDIATAFIDYPTVQQSLGVFAEKIPQGIVLHYKPTGAYEGLRLLWTGDSIGAFKLAHTLPNGRIILKKNRDLIVLQLMKGDTPATFEDLTNRQQPYVQ